MRNTIACKQSDKSEKWFFCHHPVPVLISTAASEKKNPTGSESRIVVGANQHAILVKDNVIYDCLPMGRYPLSIELFPEFAKAFPQGDSNVDVYFINMDIQWSLYFGTSNGPMHVVDPVCYVEYRLYLFGRLVLVPEDLRAFFQKIMELGSFKDTYGAEKVLDVCRNLINARLKKNVNRVINEHMMSVLNLSYPVLTHCVRQTVEEDLKPYGLSLDSFYLDTMRINDEDMSRCLKALQQMSMENIVDSFPVGVVQRTKMATPRMQPSNTKCRFCNSEIPALARFCPNCGQLASINLK